MSNPKIVDIDNLLLPELRGHADVGYQFAQALGDHKGDVVVKFGKQVAQMIVDERKLVNRRGDGIYPKKVQLTHYEGFAHFSFDPKTAFAFAILTDDVWLSGKINSRQLTRAIQSGKMFIGETKEEKQAFVLYTNSGGGFKLVVVQMHPFAQLVEEFAPSSMINVEPATAFITSSIDTIWNNKADLKQPSASVIQIESERIKDMMAEVVGSLPEDKLALYTLASIASGASIRSTIDVFKKPMNVNSIATRLFPSNKYHRMGTDPSSTILCLMRLLNKAFVDVNFVDGDWKEDCFLIIQGAMPPGIIIEKFALSEKMDAVYAAMVIKFVQSLALSDSFTEIKSIGFWKSQAGKYLNKIYHEVISKGIGLTNFNLVIGCAYWHSRIQYQLGPESKVTKSTGIMSLFDSKPVPKKIKAKPKSHESEDEKGESVGSSSEEDDDYEDDDFLVDEEESDEEEEDEEESGDESVRKEKKHGKRKQVDTDDDEPKKKKKPEKTDTDDDEPKKKKKPEKTDTDDDEPRKKKKKLEKKDVDDEPKKKKKPEKKKDEPKKKQTDTDDDEPKKKKKTEKMDTDNKKTEKKKQAEKTDTDDDEPKKKKTDMEIVVEKKTTIESLMGWTTGKKSVEFLPVIEVEKLNKEDKKQYFDSIDSKQRDVFRTLLKKSANNTSLVSSYMPTDSRVLMIKLTHPLTRNKELQHIVSNIFQAENGCTYDFCEKDVITELLVSHSWYIRRMILGTGTIVRLCPVSNDKEDKRPVVNAEKGMEYVFFYVGTGTAIDELALKIQNSLKDYVLSTAIFALE